MLVDVVVVDEIVVVFVIDYWVIVLGCMWLCIGWFYIVFEIVDGNFGDCYGEVVVKVNVMGGVFGVGGVGFGIICVYLEVVMWYYYYLWIVFFIMYCVVEYLIWVEVVVMGS